MLADTAEDAAAAVFADLGAGVAVVVVVAHVAVAHEVVADAVADGENVAVVDAATIDGVAAAGAAAADAGALCWTCCGGLCLSLRWWTSREGRGGLR